MDEPKKIAPFQVFDLVCPECGSLMILRKSRKWGKFFYGCSQYPKCLGAHGAHPNGQPLGQPASKDVKDARVRVHGLLNMIWDYNTKIGRNKMYAWLARNTSTGHISQLPIDELLVVERKLQRMV